MPTMNRELGSAPLRTTLLAPYVRPLPSICWSDGENVKNSRMKKTEYAGFHEGTDEWTERPDVKAPPAPPFLRC